MQTISYMTNTTRNKEHRPVLIQTTTFLKELDMASGCKSDPFWTHAHYIAK